MSSNSGEQNGASWLASCSNNNTRRPDATLGRRMSLQSKAIPPSYTTSFTSTLLSLSPSLATSFNSRNVNFQQRNVTPRADGPESGIPIQ